MAADAIRDNRIKAAREREDAWLEKQVREDNKSMTAANPTAAPATPVKSLANAERSNEVQQAVRMKPHDDRQNRNADYWKDIPQENNFQYIVNEEDQMYDDIEAVSMDGDNMVNQILAIVKKHVSEVWAPPHVNARADKYNKQASHTTSRPTMEIGNLGSSMCQHKGPSASGISSNRHHPLSLAAQCARLSMHRKG